MDDQEFEGYPVINHPVAVQGQPLELEQDPLFDPLSIPDDGSSGQIHTEAFMQNMVEIKTEILDEYPVDEPESHHEELAESHHDEMDIQDDLEVNHADAEAEAVTRLVDHHPHIITEKSDDENATEDEMEEEESGLGESVEDQLVHPMNGADLDEPTDSSVRLNGDLSVDPSTDHPPEADETEFSELQITNVEGSADPDASHSPTPNYEDIVTDAGAVEKPNGLESVEHPDPDTGFGHYDENEMQQLESLEEMLNFAQTNVTEPTSDVDNVVGSVGFDFSHFGVDEGGHDKSDADVGIGLQVSNTFSFAKESFSEAVDGATSGNGNVDDESVDFILQEVAGEIGGAASYDPLN